MIYDLRMEKVKIKSFTDLNVWKEGHLLALQVYKATKSFPKEERYSLVDQMRRSASSVTANVAEGFGRQGYKEKVQFYYLAQGSLTELKNFILLAKDLSYLDHQDYVLISDQADLTHKLLQGFIKKTKSYLILNHKS